MTSVRWIAFVLVAAMVLGMIPAAFASATTVDTKNYEAFLTNVKTLETYADSYAASSGEDATKLVLNYLRTSVDRYNDDNWTTLAGEEITEFTEYVEAQNATLAAELEDMVEVGRYEIVLPNGQQTDVGHMFGCMNISYVNSGSADLSGWAGDICDLLYYSKNFGNVPEGTIDEMTAYVLENCFGVDADDAFGMDDFYGDMDAYYLTAQVKAGTKLSAAMEAYFTAELTDVDRAAYFLNNRFSGLETQDDVRTAIYDAYVGNVGLQILESKRELSDCTDLRMASCYAFADYVYGLAGDRLEGDTGSDDEESENPYYSVFSSTESILAPGITQTINYATSSDNKQMVYYVATVEVGREDVTIMANYKDNDPSAGWGMQRVEDQANALLNNYKDKYENFNVIVATNGNGYNMSTGEPGGLLIMDGKEWHAVDSNGFFAILKDGSAVIGTKADYDTYKDQIQEAIGGFGAVLIKGGEIVTTNNSTRASRTAIGIKADGSVVMMVLDGRQEPFSCGGTMVEIAQIMYDAGCVHAINLDGGGSSTYLSKPEGSDSLKLVSRPSDGYARSVATTLVAVSTAEPSDKFDHAIISSDYDYLTANTQLQINAIGVNNIGGAAALPEGAIWQVSDETIGTITADGLFTALANGTVEAQLVVDGAVVGSKTLNVVTPDALAFEKERITVIYGVPTNLPLVAYYNGNPVAFSESDVFMALEVAEAGTLDGLVYTGNEAVGIRSVMVIALLWGNDEIGALATIDHYKADEAYFDFDNATSGNRTLAWLREVYNATTKDGFVYQIVPPGEAMGINYTFALDMTTIEIPAQLADLTYMLPGADAGATAWDFLLQLAERVGELTEVRISMQLDTDLEVDISELKIANNYFYLKSAELDENNVLTIVAGWYDQTQAIDPATANPICILSGLKATPKEDAVWNSKEQLVINNTGTVSYKIFLRASSLYSFSNKPENQAEYGLLPYSGDQEEFYLKGEPLLYGGAPEQGAYFGTTYADFEDNFTLDKSVLQGWQEEGQELYYYVDSVPVTGTQYLPGYEDPTVNLFYTFDENGVCTGTVTGIIEYNGGLYYAIKGVRTTGWLATYDADGNAVDYYFDPATGKAVDGVQAISGYTYTFTDYILTRGDLVTDANGTRYRWAGKWLHGVWFDVDGNTYYVGKYKYYVTTGYASVLTRDTLEWKWHLFDENGVFQSNYTGLHIHGEDTYYIVNGLRDSTVGLVYEDGYYYYISASDAAAYKNGTFWISNTHGMIPVGHYTFDENGRITNPPTVDPEEPEEPETPETPEVTYDGIVEINGVLYYYEDDVLMYGAGVVKLTDDAGQEFYIYVRSSGQLATGNYWITETNDLLESGMYNFGDNGRYYPTTEEPEEPVEPEDPDVLNGIVEINGVLYYYENNVKMSGLGVKEMADEMGRTFYIYVRSNGQLATGVYWPTNRNDLLSRGAYDWGTDGKYYPPVIDDSEAKNGIVEENGVYYYYENNVLMSGAGVVQMVDEEGKTFYIYVRSSGQLATGLYWPTNRNGYLDRGQYDWGEDGKLYL
ncbi:MAG: phosphodiester glycosidase family protein [Oscillospiraceae bacterium]|nr:phosphodiester glycosidase family protein [Oscillospiraceae bacterium]